MALTYDITTKRVTYWQVFRLIFVIFFLYLMGDAFYRWDGFSYYASFYEFVPSLALVTIVWSTVAVFTAIVIWLSGKGFERLGLYMRLKIKTEHLLMFIFYILLMGIAVWIGKRILWQNMEVTIHLKRIVLFCVTFAAILLTWLFWNKIEQVMGIIQELITPLVWLFGIWLVLSVPLVVYHTWGKQADNVVSKKLYQSSVADKNRPNIILVTFDTLTSRDMSVYGYYRSTTPFISKWAKTASLFTRVQAESNFTTPSAASLMTGKRVWTHQTYQIDGSKPDKSNIENLPLVLKNNGYYSMALIANNAASVNILGISDSFDIYYPFTEFMEKTYTLFELFELQLFKLFGDKIRLYNWIMQKDFIVQKFFNIMGGSVSGDFSITPRPPKKVFKKFLSVIDNNPPEPFFAWIHIFPPHHVYLPPEPFKGMFDSSPKFRTYLSQINVMGITLKNILNKYKYFPPEMQPILGMLRARYNEHIRYCDKEFEDFIEQLTIRKILKNTIVILSSDHGESFEHDWLGHSGPHLYEQLTHIPLIIKENNQIDEKIINNIVEQIDIPPTILDIVGIPVPLWMEGRSLVPLMRGKSLHSIPVFSMNFEKNPGRGQQITRGTIAVWDGDYKLIYYLEEKKSLLFNLKHDPDELNNLFDKEPKTGQRLLSLILDNLKEANERIKRGS